MVNMAIPPFLRCQFYVVLVSPTDSLILKLGGVETGRSIIPPQAGVLKKEAVGAIVTLLQAQDDYRMDIFQFAKGFSTSPCGWGTQTPSEVTQRI